MSGTSAGAKKGWAGRRGSKSVIKNYDHLGERIAVPGVGPWFKISNIKYPKGKRW